MAEKEIKNDQEKQSAELQKLQQDYGYNPMSGCLWSFLPLPIMIALYSIIRQPITHFMMISQEVVQKLGTIEHRAEDLINRACDHICRFPGEADPYELPGICEECPVNKLAELIGV